MSADDYRCTSKLILDSLASKSRMAHLPESRRAGRPKVGDHGISNDADRMTLSDLSVANAELTIAAVARSN
jgi:hypothetical protein